ncbi:hypothetical protein AVEN_212153-1 [Araneus ventricosus]|uniref:Uncharacterized protein n=1 Tax=Araneus ventricosus TaxID=182803 RepID=A0A4Y2L4P4_ARAVE|nr:hypothetical protein AVEN_232004-1 [Araneus ventricosus]GBN09482.1 hypothetical protein AVEN_212153-1 [Araneus ventricosus]
MQVNLCNPSGMDNVNQYSISLHERSSNSTVTCSNAFVMCFFKFCMSITLVRCTLSFTKSHREKSNGMRSGNHGSHLIGSFHPIHISRSKEYRLGVACATRCAHIEMYE